MKVSSQSRIEADVLVEIPGDMSLEVGNLVVAYSNLEHQFTAIIAIILQLNKPEARLALQSPPIFDSLDVVQDLLALKDFRPKFDFTAFREELKEINIWRNSVAHGVWLRHPETKAIYLRLTRGWWKQTQSFQPAVRRVVFPESVPMGKVEIEAITTRIKAAIEKCHVLGGYVDGMLAALPERFGQRAPLVDPLARRDAPKSPALRVSSPEKPSKRDRRAARIESAKKK